ncbi:M48 family metallopeptidase [Neisseria dentiae]|uniref:M48 family metallopeptidase n=1 Tax=Neisseria dentiae TaxID=194197 RepID=UPI00359F6380
MAESITVRYYDGKHNMPHQAELSLDGERLRIVYGGGQTDFYPLHSAAYLAGVGGVLPVLELPDDARIEFPDHHVPDWLPLKHKTMLQHVGRFEQSWKWAGIGLIVVICVIAAMFKWGIPTAAYYAARHLPEQTLNSISGQAEQAIVGLTDESRLSAERKREISKLYQTLKPEQPAKLLFRQGSGLGANAFAIPNNTIVLTDELVALAENDNEILAVLAHEQGHLSGRHSLQQALRGIGTGVFLILITGDAGDLLSNLPAMLVAAQYSQEFELEADRYAISVLKRQNIPPKHLADFLQRLNSHHGHDESGTAQVFSSHPVTAERVKQVEMLAK